MTPDNQDLMLLDIIGEPADGNQSRWTQAQRFRFINRARRHVAEETRCFQVDDSQQTAKGTSKYSVSNDFIGFRVLECGGRRLRMIRPEDWRDIIGDDDTLQGYPAVCTYFARQFQLFQTPSVAETLRYAGWAYPSDIQAGGADPDFTDRMAEASIHAAGAAIKKADERDWTAEEADARRIMDELKKQYRPKGPRYVRDQSLPIYRGIIRG